MVVEFLWPYDIFYSTPGLLCSGHSGAVLFMIFLFFWFCSAFFLRYKSTLPWGSSEPLNLLVPRLRPPRSSREESLMLVVLTVFYFLQFIPKGLIKTCWQFTVISKPACLCNHLRRVREFILNKCQCVWCLYELVNYCYINYLRVWV